MEFIFQISDYNDPALEAETAELLRQRLEAYSRQAAPGLWKATDKLNAYAAKGPGREKRRKRYCVYGAFLIALGIFTLVPGLTEPKIPSLIFAGGFAVAWGVWSLCFRERKPPALPASCRKEAAELLANHREAYWEQSRAEVRVDEAGISITVDEIQNNVPYGEITGVFEAERLWLLVYSGEKAMLLQKQDLRAGEEGAFLPYLQKHIKNSNLPYKGEST